MRYITRIRTVKNEMFHHEELFDKEQETGLPLRLAFISLLTVCDREGRFVWSPRSLKTHCLPHDDCAFDAVLENLISIGLIAKYEHDNFPNKVFGVVIKFGLHQAINNQESLSELPPMQGLNDLQGAEYMTYNERKESKNKKKQRVVNASATNKEQGTRNKEQGTYLTSSEGKEVLDIFNFYLYIFNKKNISRLTENRIKLISNKLKEYSPDQIKAVILGYKLDKFWQGENKNKTVFDDINYYLTQPENFERFVIEFNKNLLEYSQTEIDILESLQEHKNPFEEWKTQNFNDFNASESV